MTAQPEYSPSEIEFLRRCVSKRRVGQPQKLISSYIEGHRIYPKGTPFPGPHRNKRAPHVVEIMDNMSPYSGITHQDIMKSSQVCITAAAESIIAYYMEEEPSEIIYVTSTQLLLEKWESKRFQPLVQSCGISRLMTDSVNNPKSKKDGDKTFSKKYYGGSLDLASAQSASSLRSDSKKIGIIDEADGAPELLRTGEGNYIDVIFGRLSAFESSGLSRFMVFTTPKEYNTSLIWPRYKLGDQRQFMVPCPHCGKYQWLDADATEKSSYGLRPERQGGVLIGAYYLCEFCHDAIQNHHKILIFNKGHWEPTTQSISPSRRSYQISSLYSPSGMLSFKGYWELYEAAMSKPDGMRSFTNLYKGMPYRETGAKPILQNVIELRGPHTETVVPDEVVFITTGLDVQRGSEKDDKNPPRLELEILGHGFGWRSWSIDYKVFEGPVDDPNAGAWAKLQSWAEEGGLVYKKESGLELPVSMIFMDANDNFSTSAVYEFTAGWGNTMPIRGASSLKKKKNEKEDKIDEMPAGAVRRFRFVKADNDIDVVMINTAFYKSRLYTRLKIVRIDGDEQKPGFCDFPLDRPDAYFEQLTAEEHRLDGSFYCPSGRRNEALDCRVYAMCAADVFLDARVTEAKLAAKKAGWSHPQIQNINSAVVMRRMVERMVA